MSLIAPQNFFFALLLGAILLLYVLRLRRKERVVASTMLWQSALRDLQANSPWQKLRSSLLMWLQLAFLLLAVLALVRPAIKVFASTGQTVAIILDASGSMAATDVGPSRFDRARQEANRLIGALASTDQATIIAAGAQTRVLAPLTADKNVLKRAIANAQTQDTAGNLRDAVVLAGTLLRNARNKRGAQIYVLSDGAVPPLVDISNDGIGMQFVKVGTRNNNIGLTALDVRRAYAPGSRPQIFVTAQNFSSQARTVNLELSRNNDLLAIRPLTLPAAGGGQPGSQSQLFDDIAFDDGLFSVHLDVQDDLETDNRAYVNLEAPRNLKVLLVASDNVFLERALNLDPHVQVFKATANDLKALAARQQYDVVVCDGVAPAGLPDTNQLVFNTITNLSPVKKIGVAAQPTVADWDRKHPATRFAPWSDIKFAQAQAVRLLSWGQAVVEAERTPLIVAGERNGKRVVWCGFDLRDTDLPLRVAFPIFITSSLQWLTASHGSDRGGSTSAAPIAAGATGAALRSGETVALEVPPGVREVSIVQPDKSTRRLPVESSPLLYKGTFRTGIYEARANDQSGWKQRFGVSLLNKNESDLRPRDAIPVSDGRQLGAETHARANRELWGYLALAALLLLTAEWWVYHRGV